MSIPAGDLSSTARPERGVQKRDAKPAIHALERSNRFFGTSVFGRGPDWSITRYEDPIDRRDLSANHDDTAVRYLLASC